MMQNLILVAVGLAGLAIFAIVGRMQDRQAGLVRSAKSFMWLWAMVAVINSGFSVLFAGAPVVNELASFIPVFGIPFGAAWYLVRRFEVGM